MASNLGDMSAIQTVHERLVRSAAGLNRGLKALHMVVNPEGIRDVTDFAKGPEAERPRM